jgi:hypothetical protein
LLFIIYIHLFAYLIIFLCTHRGRDSLVGIAMGYELDGWTSTPDSSKSLSLLTMSRLGLGPIQPSVKVCVMYVKCLGLEIDTSPASSAKVKCGGIA